MGKGAVSGRAPSFGIGDRFSFGGSKGELQPDGCRCPIASGIPLQHWRLSVVTGTANNGRSSGRSVTPTLQRRSLQPSPGQSPAKPTPLPRVALLAQQQQQQGDRGSFEGFRPPSMASPRTACPRLAPRPSLTPHPTSVTPQAARSGSSPGTQGLWGPRARSASRHRTPPAVPARTAADHNPPRSAPGGDRRRVGGRGLASLVAGVARGRRAGGSGRLLVPGAPDGNPAAELRPRKVLTDRVSPAVKEQANWLLSSIDATLAAQGYSVQAEAAPEPLIDPLVPSPPKLLPEDPLPPEVLKALGIELPPANAAPVSQSPIKPDVGMMRSFPVPEDDDDGGSARASMGLTPPQPNPPAAKGTPSPHRLSNFSIGKVLGLGGRGGVKEAPAGSPAAAVAPGPAQSPAKPPRALRPSLFSSRAAAAMSSPPPVEPSKAQQQPALAPAPRLPSPGPSGSEDSLLQEISRHNAELESRLSPELERCVEDPLSLGEPLEPTDPGLFPRRIYRERLAAGARSARDRDLEGQGTLIKRENFALVGAAGLALRPHPPRSQPLLSVPNADRCDPPWQIGRGGADDPPPGLLLEPPGQDQHPDKGQVGPCE